MGLQDDLSRRLHLPELEEWSLKIRGDKALKESFLHLLFYGKDIKVAENVAWVLTDLNPNELDFLHDKCGACIHLAMNTKSNTLRRLLFALLLKMPLPRENAGIELLDYCLQAMISARFPIGIRAQAIYLAYDLCKDYPELLKELEANLLLLNNEELMPGLKKARYKVLLLIQK